jgi:glycosyltransferase involved in cell wall biosynthesis
MKLMIMTPYYPPIFTAGGTRIFEMVKYLSTKPEIERIDVILWAPYLNFDPKMIPKLEKVHVWPVKFGTGLPGALLKHQDSNPFYLFFWSRFTRKYAKRLKPDLVFFSAPPGVILSGAKWCKTAGIKYIIDYRDDWMLVNKYIIEEIGGLKAILAMYFHRITERIANNVHEDALLIATVHKEITSRIGIGGPNTIEVKNGIIISEIQTALANVEDSYILEDNCRHIVYVGHLLASDYRPELILPFLKSIGNVKLLLFTTKVTKEFDKKIDDAGVRNLVLTLNEPYNRMLPILSKCDMGIMFIQSGIPTTSFAVPSKFYDYISAGIPVLIIADEHSFVYQFVKKYGTGISLNWNELDKLEDSVNTILTDKKHRETAKSLAPTFLNMFDRNKQYELLYNAIMARYLR